MRACPNEQITNEKVAGDAIGESRTLVTRHIIQLDTVVLPCADVVLPIADIADFAVPGAEEGLLVADVALPCIEGTLPCAVVALPCSRGAEPCADVALPCADMALPCADGALTWANKVASPSSPEPAPQVADAANNCSPLDLQPLSAAARQLLSAGGHL